MLLPLSELQVAGKGAGWEGQRGSGILGVDTGIQAPRDLG